MGPIASWITDPNVNLAFNSARGLGAAGAAFATKPAEFVNPYTAAAAPFNELLGLQNRINENEASAYDAQAELALMESDRDAAVKAREAKEFQQEQALKYSAAGVLLEGSPAAVMERTRALAQEEIDAISARGQATSDLLRRRGNIGRMQGRASLLGEKTKFAMSEAQMNLAAMQNTSNPFLDSLGSLGGLFSGNSRASVPRTTGAKRNPAIAGRQVLQGASSAVAGLANYKWAP